MNRIKLINRQGVHWGDADIPPFNVLPDLVWSIDRAMQIPRYFTLTTTHEEAALRLGAPYVAEYTEVEFAYAIPYMVGEEPK